MKKIFYALAALSIIQLSLNSNDANAQSWQWAKQMGGNIAGLNTEDSRDEVLGMEVDKRGNSYILFRTCTDKINPNKIQIDGTDINRNFGGRDFVLASLDCSGKFRWAKAFGGPSNVDNPFSLKIDTLGGVYVSGFVYILKDSARIDLDTTLKPEPVVFPTPEKTEWRSWAVIKYDSSGNYKWVRMPEPDTLGGSRRSAAFTMDVSPNGKVSLLTVLRTTGAFASGAYILPASTSLPAVHLLQYDANGNFIKGFPMAISGTSYANMAYLRMAWDWKNDVYYIGAIKYIGEPALSFGSTAQTGSNLLAKFSNTGSVLWAKQSTKSSSTGSSKAPVLDKDGNVYISLTEDIGSNFNGFNVVNSYSSGVQIPVFIKLNSSGTNLWAVNVNGIYGASGVGCAINQNNQIALYAQGPGEMSFDTFKTYGSGTSAGVIQLVLNTNTGALISFDTARGNNLCNFNAACADAHGNFYSAYSYDVNLKVGSTTLGKYGGLTDIGFVKFGEASCDAIPTSIVSQSSIATVKIYPNPANDYINIDGLQSSTELSLYNIVGQEVKHIATQNNKAQIGIAELPSGMYLLHLKTATGDVYTTKIVKE